MSTLFPSNASTDTTGCFGVYDGGSGTTQIFNNTYVGPNGADPTLCVGIQFVNNLYFENNTIAPCGNPVQILNTTNTVAANIDYNFYGLSCQNGANCFQWAN